MYLDKVCQVNFNFSSEICADGNYTMEEDGSLLVDQVQSYVSTLNIYGSLINTIPSIFFVLFLGPWSDVHGRKPLMIAPLLGNILSTCILALIYFVGSSLTAEYLLFTEIPASFLGGSTTLYMAFLRYFNSLMTVTQNNSICSTDYYSTQLSYMADITSESTRTSRISFLVGTYALSTPIGSFTSRYILQYGGHTAIWCSTLSCYVFGLLWIIFYIQDSRGKGSKLGGRTIEPGKNRTVVQSEITNESEGIFAILKNLKHCFVVTLKPRTGFKRACLVIILAAKCIAMLSDCNPFEIVLEINQSK